MQREDWGPQERQDFPRAPVESRTSGEAPSYPEEAKLPGRGQQPFLAGARAMAVVCRRKGEVEELEAGAPGLFSAS